MIRYVTFALLGANVCPRKETDLTRIWLVIYKGLDRVFFDSKRVFAMGCIVLMLGLSVLSHAEEVGPKAHVCNDDILALIYSRLGPVSHRPSFSLFQMGVRGYDKLVSDGRIENRQYLTLIDYSLSSNQRRLWVIDLECLRIRHHALVAHGRNSGNEFAVKFSNVPDSKMSSLGFFITGQTYQGKHGFSLVIEGIEPGINDNARRRAIVIHSADYATRRFADMHGRLGRSYGCPALPPYKGDRIIDLIKNRSCMFIYSPNQAYRTKTQILPRSSPDTRPLPEQRWPFTKLTPRAVSSMPCSVIR